MYQRLPLQQKEDYFLPMSQREKKGTYFCRCIGFEEELLLFERKLQLVAEKNGSYIAAKLQQPREREVSAFFQEVGQFTFTMQKKVLEQVIRQWLKGVPPMVQKTMVDAVFHALAELAAEGNNLNILKNAFVKFMCWLKGYFIEMLPNLGQEDVPKIVYEGEISKYELYVLRILSLSGCDVAYIHFATEEFYLQGNSQGDWSDVIYGKRRGIPPKHFTKINLTALQQQAQLQQQAEQAAAAIVRNDWMTGEFTQWLFQDNSKRGIEGKRYTMYIRYLGVDQTDAYQNRLYHWKEQAKTEGIPFVLIQHDIENPSMEEARALQLKTYQTEKEILQQLGEKLLPKADTLLRGVTQRAFFKTMKQGNWNSLSRLYNTALKLVCWCNRYVIKLLEGTETEKIPFFFYYGKINESEVLFLQFLSQLPIDVLYVSPKKEYAAVFQKVGEDGAVVVELPDSQEVDFPKKPVRMKIATVAYQAERELDTLLYEDTGMFRNRQFIRSHPVTLKTVYEEIELLWKEEAKYRPGFETKQDSVTVPNIFAKINGIKEGDVEGYWRQISALLTENTIFIEKFPYINQRTSIQNAEKLFLKEGKLLPEVIQNHSAYPYDFLSLDTQAYMLEKIQELLDLHWILAEQPDETILSVLLQLDKRTVQLIQQFDFTKEVPKVIVVSVGETMASLEDAIYLLYLNLIGFDIAVFTPTGYRNIEKYISEKAFESYQIGEYFFQLEVPRLAKLQRNSSGENRLISRLFGRRK